MAGCVTTFWVKVVLKISDSEGRPVQKQDEEGVPKWNVSQTKIRIISTIIFILFGCVLFVALPAVIFKHIEGWSALDAIYFVVITLTTIGFGDYVAGGSDIEYLDFYKPVVWFWILVGLAYFAAVLSMIGDWLRVISKKTKEEALSLTPELTGLARLAGQQAHESPCLYLSSAGVVVGHPTPGFGSPDLIISWCLFLLGEFASFCSRAFSFSLVDLSTGESGMLKSPNTSKTIDTDGY
ncbi:hypothetical protein STEG23_018838, partial [Scotinomys teguina]